MGGHSCPNSISKLCFAIQGREFKWALEKNHIAETPVEILSELHALSVRMFPGTIIESPSVEGNVCKHLDPTLKVGCFIFPSISLTIRNIWNVLFAGYKNKSNRQSCVGKNLFFLGLRSLALGLRFQAHHFPSAVSKVNGRSPALRYCFLSGCCYQDWPHFPSWCSLFCPLWFLGNVLFYLIIASCSVRITVRVVVLLIRPLNLFPGVCWFSTRCLRHLIPTGFWLWT